MSTVREAMTIEAARWQFTVADYHRMREISIFSEADRVELIDGKIIHRLVGDQGIVSTQTPIELDDHSEPQPDFVIVHSRDDYSANGHPRPEDVLVVIEVSDTSLDYDRMVKLGRYADAYIPEAWIIDPVAHTIEQYTQPINGRYTRIHILQHGDTLNAQTLALDISIDALFGL